MSESYVRIDSIVFVMSIANVCDCDASLVHNLSIL